MTLSPDRRARLLLAMALAALPGVPLIARAEGSGASSAAHAPLRVIRGSVARLTPESLLLETPEGTISLALDRNTTVFLEERVGTLQDLGPGTTVRADVGPDHRASWIEVEPRLAPRAGPGHVTAGPIVLPAPAPAAPAAAVIAGPGGGEEEGTGGAGVDVPAGPDAPEPNPGAGPTSPVAPPSRAAAPAGG